MIHCDRPRFQGETSNDDNLLKIFPFCKNLFGIDTSDQIPKQKIRSEARGAKKAKKCVDKYKWK